MYRGWEGQRKKSVQGFLQENIVQGWLPPLHTQLIHQSPSPEKSQTGRASKSLRSSRTHQPRPEAFSQPLNGSCKSSFETSRNSASTLSEIQANYVSSPAAWGSPSVLWRQILPRDTLPEGLTEASTGIPSPRFYLPSSRSSSQHPHDEKQDLLHYFT